MGQGSEDCGVGVSHSSLSQGPSPGQWGCFCACSAGNVLGALLCPRAAKPHTRGAERQSGAGEEKMSHGLGAAGPRDGAGDVLCPLPPAQRPSSPSRLLGDSRAPSTKHEQRWAVVEPTAGMQLPRVPATRQFNPDSPQVIGRVMEKTADSFQGWRRCGNCDFPKQKEGYFLSVTFALIDSKASAV